jgi:hypothetical protein
MNDNPKESTLSRKAVRRLLVVTVTLWIQDCQLMHPITHQTPTSLRIQKARTSLILDAPPPDEETPTIDEQEREWDVAVNQATTVARQAGKVPLAKRPKQLRQAKDKQESHNSEQWHNFSAARPPGTRQQTKERSEEERACCQTQKEHHSRGRNGKQVRSNQSAGDWGSSIKSEECVI